MLTDENILVNAIVNHGRKIYSDVRKDYHMFWTNPRMLLSRLSVARDSLIIYRDSLADYFDLPPSRLNACKARLTELSSSCYRDMSLINALLACKHIYSNPKN